MCIYSSVNTLFPLPDERGDCVADTAFPFVSEVHFLHPGSCLKTVDSELRRFRARQTYDGADSNQYPRELL